MSEVIITVDENLSQSAIDAALEVKAILEAVVELTINPFIKSDQPLSLSQRKGNILYGILDQYTGEEITLSKVTGTPTVDNIIYFQLGSEYFKRVYNDNTIRMEWFGCGDDGADDTSIFQTVINRYEDSRPIITSKFYLKITNQINIIYGITLKDITIRFDNSESDQNGNALKHLFYLNSSNYGTLSSLSFDNLTLLSTNESAPKNQHIVFLEGQGFAEWTINNIYSEYFTGSFLHLKGDGTIYHPEFYQIRWTNILLTQCGGFISQSNLNTDTWVVGGTIENIDIEHGIRQISPQPILMNLKGFRNVNLDNLTFQGGNSNGVNEMIFTDKDVSLSNVWMEFISNKPPIYWHNNGGISTGKNIFGIEPNCKVKSTGKLSLLKLNDIFLYDDANACFDSFLGGKIDIDGIKIESFSENQDFSNKRPVNNLTRLGNVKFKNISTFSGGGYSSDDNIQIFKHSPGILIKTNQEYPLSDNVYFGSDNLVITTKEDDGQEGRILSLKTGSGAGFPNGYFLINRLGRFAGSSMVIAIRMRVNVANAVVTNFWTPALRNDRQGVSLDGSGEAIVDLVNSHKKFNQWYTCYLSISELTGSNLYVYLAPQSNDLIGDCEVLISDIEIVLGDKLPILKGSNKVNRNLVLDEMPTIGTWKSGDIVYKQYPSVADYIGWVCINGGSPGVWKGFGLIEA